MGKIKVFLIFAMLFLVLRPSEARSSTQKANFQLPTIKVDTAKKTNLLKKLSEAIKFRKNSITKEQKRVQIIIEKMIARDSTIATVQDLEKLKQDMSESNKQQFDTLLELIKEIKISENTPQIVVQAPDGTPGNKPFKVTKELDPNDKYINDLVDRLIPILTDTKEDDNKVKTRQERLKLMRDIYAKKNTFTDTINDSTAIRYKLKLSHKAEVLGNHQYDAGYRSNQYNFSTLTGLIYNSYDLDGNTGFAKNFNSWGSAPVITSTKEAGSKVFLNVTTASSAEIARFLTNETAMRNMISSSLELLDQRDADGINIAITGLNRRLRSHFVDFIGSLSKAYRAKQKQYQISITLPVYDDVKAYDIAHLDTLVDKFIINFSKKPTNFPGPIAPLNDDSDYNIQSSVSRYLNQGLPPYKFILCLSYYGVEFQTNPDSGIETFKGYIPYKAIRLNYQYAPVTYNKEQAFASIETRDDEGNLTGHIYYDNEASLEQKYDFIIQNGLGGVAIWDLGADEGYGELWDALANKFVKIDTVSKETFSLRPTFVHDTTVWGYIKKNMVAYYYALQHPCDPNYDQPETLLLTIFNILLALISIAVTITLIYKIKENGEKWRWKKTLIRILIVCVNLFIITIFMWLYIDNSIPWFGAGENCLDMPFTVLLLIIFTGILLGSLIMRFLIFPAIQHDEKP
jgi:spore germination protein YaaH